METLFWPAVNLSLLIALLAYKLKGPMKTYIRSRHETIRSGLDEAQSLLSSAQSQFDEFSAKLKGLKNEVVLMERQSREGAESARDKMLNQAKEAAGLIVSDARESAVAAANDLKDEIRIEFAEGVISEAERLIQERLTGDDRERIRKEFSSQVGGLR